MSHPLADAVAALPPEKQEAAAKWIEAAIRDGKDSIAFTLVTGVVEGKMAIADVRADGEVMFSLTQAGRDAALEILHRSPEARAMWERMSGQAFVNPPEGEQ